MQCNNAIIGIVSNPAVTQPLVLLEVALDSSWPLLRAMIACQAICKSGLFCKKCHCPERHTDLCTGD